MRVDAIVIELPGDKTLGIFLKLKCYFFSILNPEKSTHVDFKFTIGFVTQFYV